MSTIINEDYLDIQDLTSDPGNPDVDFNRMYMQSAVLRHRASVGGANSLDSPAGPWINITPYTTLGSPASSFQIGTFPNDSAYSTIFIQAWIACTVATSGLLVRINSDATASNYNDAFYYGNFNSNVVGSGATQGTVATLVTGSGNWAINWAADSPEMSYLELEIHDFVASSEPKRCNYKVEWRYSGTSMYTMVGSSDYVGSGRIQTVDFSILTNQFQQGTTYAAWYG